MTVLMLPAGLPPDTLGGHRTRFYDQYKALKKFYNTTANMQFFKNLIRVPHLPEVRVATVLVHVRATAVLVHASYTPFCSTCIASLLDLCINMPM